MATLCKLDIDDQPFSLYLLTQQNGDSLELHAFDGTECWMAKLTGGNLAEMARKVTFDEDRFKDETFKALTRQNLGLLNFVYSVVKKGEGRQMELTWKKHILTNNVKFLLGSVTLNVCHEQGATGLLDFAVSALEKNRQEIGDLQKENVRLSSERQGALSRLEKCANLQDDIEKDLYGRFKVVLNEKKAKIRRLMEQLRTISSQLQQTTQHQSAVNKPSIADGSAEKDKEKGDSSHDETDDEIEHSPSPMSTEGPAHPSTPPHPSGSRLTMESLLGDPDEKEISSPPVKRRKRNVGGERAASKVKGQPFELPRPPSISRPSSTHSADKVRVQTSEGKKSGEDSIESDDLLQLL